MQVGRVDSYSMLNVVGYSMIGRWLQCADRCQIVKAKGHDILLSGSPYHSQSHKCSSRFLVYMANKFLHSTFCFVYK